jgi:hypothetical protein
MHYSSLVSRSFIVAGLVFVVALGGFGHNPQGPSQTRSGRQPKQEYETQWPGYVLTYCYPNIIIQLDRNMNTQAPKGTVVKLTMTQATKVEGNTDWPMATVQFLPSTKVASHIWFLPPALGTPQRRDEETPCQKEPSQSRQR